MAEKGKTNKKSDLAKRPESSLAHGFDYGDNAGAGWENTGSDDFTIPFLAVLQAMSPQVNEAEGEYIKGAKAGNLINTASQELFDGVEGVEFVPCYTEHLFVEWKNRQTDGGGFVAVHTADSQVVTLAKQRSTTFGKYTIDVEGGNAHDLVETFYVYGMIVDGEDVISPCMISFSSTKIKAYKAIMTPMRQVKGRPPLFAFRLRIKTVSEKNTKGTFHNFKIGFAGESAVASLMAPDHVFVLAGKEFKDQVAEGKAKIDHAGGGAGKAGDAKDGDAPF
jgi:hypothetical protein